MLIYNVASRKATIGKNKGKTVYFAKPIGTSRLTAQAVEDHIVEKSSLTRGDIRHAITSLAEVLRWGLSERLTVDLADLGSFKVEARGKMMLSEEEVTAASIKDAVIRFYPRQKMRAYAKSVAISVRNNKAEGVGSAGTTSPAGGGGTSLGDDSGI